MRPITRGLLAHMKSYFTPRLFWRSHQLPHRFEDRGNLFIVFANP